jgi:glycosyltransferase involved in cell wall biosynthesis
MRVLFIHNTYLLRGGEDVVFEAEFNLLIQHGHEVEKLLFANNQITSVVDKLKISYQSIYNTQSARELKKVISVFKPDIIHVHNFFYLASPSIFYVAHQQGIPIVLTLHNYRLVCSGFYLLRDAQVCELCIHKKFPLDGIKHACFKNSRLQTANLTLLTSLHKFLGTWKRKINAYIVLTEFAKNKLVHSSLKLDPEKVVIKSNSVQDYGNSALVREDYFLFVGRLSPEKGISTLLSSYKYLNYKLTIVGEGELKDEVEEAMKYNSNITYLGFQPKSKIIELLKSCKALIFPSLWYEGLPNTILEAFSTGTPVIASDIDNVNEIVTNNYNGVHFRKGDASDLAHRIALFLKDTTPTIPFYENARKTFLEKYTSEKNYQQLINIYESILLRKAKNI